jgi:hypothetical protein
VEDLNAFFFKEYSSNPLAERDAAQILRKSGNPTNELSEQRVLESVGLRES